MCNGLHRIGKALPLLAVLSLVLNVLLPGFAVAAKPAARTAASPLHTVIDCAGHDGASAPAHHGQKGHGNGLCCVLCGVPGLAFGDAPVAAALAAPRRVAGAAVFGGTDSDWRTSTTVLPVGARAPPLLG